MRKRSWSCFCGSCLEIGRKRFLDAWADNDDFARGLRQRCHKKSRFVDGFIQFIPWGGASLKKRSHYSLWFLDFYFTMESHNWKLPPPSGGSFLEEA